MAGGWSIDARALVRPAATFSDLARARHAHTAGGFWIAARRPLFLTIVLASVISLIGASVPTFRLAAPTAVYWAFVPLVEVLALAVVVRHRRGARSLGALVDVFFAGYAAWTLFLLMLGGVLAIAPPEHWWFLIMRPVLIALILVVGWSAYVDVCFFRHVCGASRRRAIGDAALYRLITWTLIFWVFAVPSATPVGVIHEIADALAEVFR